MTKQEILNEFNDINYVYNNSSKHETLSLMLDELLKEREPKRMWLCNGELCCPQCGTICKSYYQYCNECGQAVKWDA